MARSQGHRVDAALARPLWWDGIPPARRPPLDGDADADVVLVGAGFSGLWTAYHLSVLDPSRRIVVVEREHVGFGASGRNGGWAVGELAGPFERWSRIGGRDAAVAQMRSLIGAVDDLGAVVAAEGIDCGWVAGGNVRVSRSAPQMARQRAEVDHMRELGFDADVIRLLDAEEARAQLAADGVRGGIFFSPCASLDPWRLASGLADAVERRGVTIHESTEVTSIDEHGVETNAGRITAPIVIRATEAYTRDLPGSRRELLPVYSMMIATAPIDESRFDRIGLARRQTFADDRRIVIYGQRTSDDRIAFGSQGVPYRYGSRISPTTELDLDAHRRIHDVLVDLLPELGDVPVSHRWGGVLGIPRDWLPSIRFDRTTRRGSLGGYVGEGVAASHLAGRTLAELVLGIESERTVLPWVHARSRRWEPEPLRWLGVRTGRRIFAMADDIEARTDRPARITHRVATALRGD